MQEWLMVLVTSHPYIVYGVIIVLSCAEGPILSMIGGVLVRFGYFPFIPIYAALMIGDLIGDSIWYWIGHRYGHRFIARFGKYFSITEEGFEKVRKIFHHYKHRILLISKMTNGFGLSLVTLTTAGMIRIPFSKYICTNVIGQFVWSGFLIGVGYFFGNAYLKVNSIFAKISIVALSILVIFAFLGYKKYLRKKAETLQLP